MRVLVTGGRDYDDYGAVKRELDALEDMAYMQREILVVIHGDARGADSLARHWCKDAMTRAPYNVQHIPCPADWKTHGMAAGPIRNQAMIDDHHPSLVLAFPGGKGTADMVRRARRAGLEVREIS